MREKSGGMLGIEKGRGNSTVFPNPSIARGGGAAANKRTKNANPWGSRWGVLYLPFEDGSWDAAKGGREGNFL